MFTFINLICTWVGKDRNGNYTISVYENQVLVSNMLFFITFFFLIRALNNFLLHTLYVRHLFIATHCCKCGLTCLRFNLRVSPNTDLLLNMDPESNRCSIIILKCSLTKFNFILSMLKGNLKTFIQIFKMQYNDCI